MKKLLFSILLLSSIAHAQSPWIFGGSGPHSLQTLSNGICSAVGNELICGGVATAPGGANTNIQYNDSNIFGGDANFTWDKTTQIFSVLGSGSLVTTLPDNTGGEAVLGSASGHSTADTSSAIFGIQGVAVNTIDSGFTNDKSVSAGVFTTTRGDGTDDGTLSALGGVQAITFHDSGASGVTSEYDGFLALLIHQQGNITDAYDFHAITVPAGGTITNHYGIYISSGPVTKKSWISGLTKLGGSSFTAPNAALDVLGSFVQGDGTTRATGANSIALGDSSNPGVLGLASGVNSISMGHDTVASGDNSLSLGETTTAAGEASIAMGSGSTANGFVSFAGGLSTLANNNQSFAFGNSVQALANNGVAFGKSTNPGVTGVTLGNAGASFGLDTVAHGVNSVSTGQNTESGGDDQLTVGHYNVLVGTSGNPQPEDELLTVGNGSGVGTEHTGFYVRRDGLVGINDGHIKATQVTPPTAAPDTSAGTGATCTVSNSTDIRGKVQVVTGTIGLSTGSYCTVTFNSAYGSAPICVLTPSGSTLSTNVYVSSTTTTLSINFAVAGGITSTYNINYQCME